MSVVYTLREAKQKAEHFCAYQERCHQEVVTKLRSMQLTNDEIDVVVVHLIEQNFLNEERFACSFARGKHRIKQWGKTRISHELQLRQINKTLVTLALKTLDPEEYYTTFHKLAEHHWDTIRETNLLKKRKKFCDFLLRKGFESNWIYEKVRELEG